MKPPCEEYYGEGECATAIQLLMRLVSAGYFVSVNDGEETTVKHSQNVTELYAALGTTAQNWLKIYERVPVVEMNMLGLNCIGKIMLVWGNAPDGSELIADHTESMTEILSTPLYTPPDPIEAKLIHKVVKPGLCGGYAAYCYIDVYRCNARVWSNGEVREYDDGLALSITGVIGPWGNGNAHGSCGQCIEEVAKVSEFSGSWDSEQLARFIEIWKKWHLNDMRAGCPHQNAEWDLYKKLEVVEYTWSQAYHRLRESLANGELVSAQHAEISKQVQAVTTHRNRALDPSKQLQFTQDLLRDGWIEEKQRGNKTANWTYPGEHPEGILAKPCPKCGYKYGTQWLYEELPQDVLDFLNSLPAVPAPMGWPHEKRSKR